MLSLLIALSAAAQLPTTTAPATADRKEIPLTLILSGGVSLGSYEAGLSWAVTRIAQVLPGHGAEIWIPPAFPGSRSHGTIPVGVFSPT